MNLLATISLSLSVVLAAPAATLGQENQTDPLPGDDPVVRWDHTHQGPHGEAHLRLEKALRCNCGCLLDLHLCQAQMQCETSPAWSKRILHLLEKGESEEVILAGFTSEFGASVLLMPPLKGLNWVGYFLPWVAILTAAAVVGKFLGNRGLRTNPNGGGEALSAEDWEQIREELNLMREQEQDSGF